MCSKPGYLEGNREEHIIQGHLLPEMVFSKQRGNGDDCPFLARAKEGKQVEAAGF